MELLNARILGIESSCDETAAAVVENGRKLLSNVVATQIDIHAEYGGVFPEVASRQHVLSIFPVVDQALKQAHLGLKDLDAIAVTQGPGLAGSLVVGMNMAKGLSQASGLPLIGINHLEGHLYSSWINEGEDGQPAPEFPLLALLVSGGHTELDLMTDHLTYQRLGGTLDDAAGEAFDKVARLLGLGYPGGPAIQRAAEKGNNNYVQFPRSWMEGSWDFSFSGIKTSVLREVQGRQEVVNDGEGNPVVNHLAASFQEAVVDVLVKKTIEAAKMTQAKSILLAGGVSANKALRERLKQNSPIPVFVPAFRYCTDNAAMIAAAGYFRFCAGQRDSLSIEVRPSWRLS